MTRTDLLALTPEVLATLTNRGLVKRAGKAVDGGESPALTTAGDGTVHATHPDGVRSSLPAAGGLGAGSCSCGAAGICRHLLVLVLAYQRQHGATTVPAGVTGTPPGATASAPDAPVGAAGAADVGSPPKVGPDGGAVAAPAPREAGQPAGPTSAVASAGPAGVEMWSPGDVTDEALAEAVGAAALAVARRLRRRGYTALVRRPTAADPVPQVELPSGTVRFLVPHQIAFAHADAADGGAAAVALAVWAYRVADREQPGRREAQVRVGGTSEVDHAVLDRAVALAGEVLLAGAVHTGAGAAVGVAAARRDLDAAGLRWPLLALDELAAQLDAYAGRSARYRPEVLAEVLAELPARRRAVVNRGASPMQRVLGTDEPAETPLRRLRLIGIGARVRELAGEVTAQVFLAHPAGAGVLVLRQDWLLVEGESLTGYTIAGRRAGGSTIGALAAGNVVTESAVRSASRRIRFAAGRIARTTVSPGGGSWADLPPGLLVRDLDALAAALVELPPRVLRPRTDAESVRVVEIAEVPSVGYAAGEQRLDAVVADPSGGVATVSAVHRSVCPGALDSLAAVLAGTHGSPRYVSGTVRRGAGGLVIEPLAVVADRTVVVPDLAGGSGDGALAGAAADPPDAVDAALRAGLGLLAQAAHGGLRHLPTGFADRLRAAGATLGGVGLDRCGAALGSFAATLGPAPGQEAVRAWVDAQIRLLATAECR
ncbi:hypothetical protein ABZ807_14940 [Micromonospora sp. NPDC047548]|uniref:hypothetical protein n=1 Tax=Micromonospora sp. NPDC047548 TaxID=3155624 RepID=UPI0033EA3F5E